MKCRRLFGLAAAAFSAAGCFPTLQNARIDPGLRIDAGFTALGDQRRHDMAQGPDHIAYIGLAYGFGRRVEFGVPVGMYFEDGIGARGALHGVHSNFVVWPYVKVALNDSDSKNHVAIVGQTALIGLANVGLRYGHDFGSWEPYTGLSYIFSGGRAGDDPVVTRYQEPGQQLIAFGAGATWLARGRPTIEVGVLRNHYVDELGFEPNGHAITRPQTFYDLFVGFRASLYR